MYEIFWDKWSFSFRFLSKNRDFKLDFQLLFFSDLIDICKYLFNFKSVLQRNDISYVY